MRIYNFIKVMVSFAEEHQMAGESTLLIYLFLFLSDVLYVILYAA